MIVLRQGLKDNLSLLSKKSVLVSLILTKTKYILKVLRNRKLIISWLSICPSPPQKKTVKENIVILIN